MWSRIIGGWRPRYAKCTSRQRVYPHQLFPVDHSTSPVVEDLTYWCIVDDSLQQAACGTMQGPPQHAHFCACLRHSSEKLLSCVPSHTWGILHARDGGEISSLQVLSQATHQAPGLGSICCLETENKTLVRPVLVTWPHSSLMAALFFSP